MPATTEKKIKTSVLFFIVVSLSFFISFSPLTQEFAPQIIAFFIFLFLSLSIIARKFNILIYLSNKEIIEILESTFIAFLLIFGSGSLFSPFFFFIYILLFATAFIIDPFASFSLASIAIFFLLLTPRKDLLSEIVQLFSLIVIAPLANLFGKEHQKNLLKQAKINLLEYQEQALSEEVKDQELAVEKWTKLILREKLIRIWKSLEKLSHILKNPHMEEEIRTIKENLKDILVSSEKLDEYIKR